MSDLKNKYEEHLIDVIDLLENLQKVNVVIQRMEKQYEEDNRSSDLFIQQYIDRRKKFEQELYVLLIQLDAPSDVFNIRFNVVVEEAAEEEYNIISLKKLLQSYLEKVDSLFVH